MVVNSNQTRKSRIDFQTDRCTESLTTIWESVTPEFDQVMYFLQLSETGTLRLKSVRLVEAVTDGSRGRFVFAIYVAVSRRPAGVKPTETIARKEPIPY